MVCPLIYLIIIGGCADLCSVLVRRWYLGYRLRVSGCAYALQRGTGGIIAARVGLVSWAVKRAQSQEKPLQSPVRCFVALVVIAFTRQNALYALVWGCIASGQNKSPAPPADARQKKSPAISDRVECFLFAGFEERREKPEEKQDTRKYHFVITSIKYALRRFCQKCNVIRCYLCEQKRHFASCPKR